jgi:DNA-binding NarL/FixJ family response regulator
VIRVCIADDQALIRSGLTALLELFDGLTVTTEAHDGEAAVAAVLADRPDVLLLDVRMPKLSGVEVLRALNAQAALPPTLLLTTFEDDAALIAGVRAGAKGFLLKGVTAEVLVEAIRTVAGGGTYLFAPLIDGSVPTSNTVWNEEAFETPEPLTPREREILKLMTSGISNREIASALHLGDGTVRNHVSNILSKLGVSDRTRAVLTALQRKLV